MGKKYKPVRYTPAIGKSGRGKEPGKRPGNLINHNEIRIARFLAICGVSSRRKCEEIINSGRVCINGVMINDPAVKVSEKDKVELDGRAVTFQKKVILALNKPAGYISTAMDNFRRRTVLDLVKDVTGDLNCRLYPVGRLDADSRGLIILTNDGELANRIMHPRFSVQKVYEVAIEGRIGKKEIDIIRNGVEVEGKELLPSELDLLCFLENKNSLIRIKISEGRKRILRKTFSKLGYKVLDLKRIQIGSFKLGDLKEGCYRILDEREIMSLLQP
ncbi:MAG: rRNA pseudouridine synthase [Actinobacteria bacterium]|nr:rRNA pseudouridine synthase [Actinomycetota bacterium]